MKQPTAPIATKSTSAPISSPVLQRKCDCGAKAKPGEKCAKCNEDEKKPLLQRKASDTSESSQPREGSEVPSIVYDVLRSPGAPLDSATRAYMEPRFGHDFSNVRIHTDSKAAESAKQLSAEAYTVGKHIVFADASTSRKSSLLAHELTHVIQQRMFHNRELGQLNVLESQASEAEAEFNAVTIDSDQSIKRTVDANGLQIQRNQDSDKGALGGCGLCYAAKPAIRDGKNVDIKFLQIGRDVHRQTQESFVVRYPELVEFHEKRVTADSNKNGSKETIDELFTGIGNPDLLILSVLEIGQRNGSTKNKSMPTFWYGEIKPDNEKGIKDGEEKLRKYDRIFQEKEKLSSGRLAVPPPSPVLFHEPNGTAKDRASGKEIRQTLSVRLFGNGLYLYSCDPGWSSEFVRTYECSKANETENKSKTEAAEDLVDYEILGTTESLVFRVPDAVLSKKNRSESPWYSLNSGENLANSLLIPGMAFLRVQPMGGKYDNIMVLIETRSEKNPKGLRMQIDAKANVAILRRDKSTKKLYESISSVKVPFDFPGMSPGEINKLAYTNAAGLAGEGVIRPDIPLLRGVVLKIAFAGEEMRVTAPVPKDKIKGLPGFRVTEAGLDFILSPEFKPSGNIAFEIGPKKKPLADGRIEVSADEQGFLAKGALNAKVPGFDEAQANVTYRPSEGWQGEAHLTTSHKFIQKAEVSARLTEQGFDVIGQVTIDLPGDQKVDLKVSKKGDAVVFTGDGKFKVPGGRLDDVNMHFTWDGERLVASGNTGFSFKGFNGRMSVHYNDGKVSGNGSLDFAKGKAKGRLNVKMSPEHNFSGDGEITYKLTDNLIATAGIAISEKEVVTLKGALEFPKPIELFKPFGGEQNILNVGLDIPIPGASVGPVGLKARIEGGLSAGYQIGPGELRNVKLESTLNPFEDSPDIDLKLSGQLFIGANAHVSGSITGKIAVDAAIASVSGGLRLTLTAELNGHMASKMAIEYQKGRFVVEGDLDLLLKLLIRMALDAVASAEAGIGPFKAQTEKKWNLASYTYDPGLQFGLRTKNPIRYDSSQPFQAPSLDQIEVIKPNFNLPDMMQRIFANSAGPEVTKG